MKRLISFALFPAILCSSPLLAAKGGKGNSGGTSTGVVQVNCSAGESLQAAIKPSQSFYTIEVSGTCRENIHVKDAQVVIDGKNTSSIVGTGDPSKLSGVVFADQSGALLLKNLSVGFSGSDQSTRGIAAFHGVVVLDNVDVNGFPNDGVFAGAGSLVRVVNSSSVTNNSDGVVVSQGAALYLGDTDLRGNSNRGVLLEKGASASVWNSTFYGNGIGIRAIQNSSVGVSCADANTASFSGNANNAIDLGFGSTAFIGDCNIQSSNSGGGIWVHRNSQIELRNGVIQGGRHGIDAVENSNVLLTGAITFKDHSWVSVAISDSSSLNQPENTGSLSFDNWGSSGSKAIRVAKSSSATLKTVNISGYDGPSIDVQTLSNLELRGGLSSSKGSSSPDILVREGALLYSETGAKPVMTNGIFCESFGRVSTRMSLDGLQNNGRCYPPEF